MFHVEHTILINKIMQIEFIKDVANYKKGEIIEMINLNVVNHYIKNNFAIEYIISEMPKIETKEKTVEFGEHIYDITDKETSIKKHIEKKLKQSKK